MMLLSVCDLVCLLDLCRECCLFYSECTCYLLSALYYIFSDTIISTPICRCYLCRVLSMCKCLIMCAGGFIVCVISQFLCLYALSCADWLFWLMYLTYYLTNIDYNYQQFIVLYCTVLYCTGASDFFNTTYDVSWLDFRWIFEICTTSFEWGVPSYIISDPGIQLVSGANLLNDFLNDMETQYYFQEHEI